MNRALSEPSTQTVGTEPDWDAWLSENGARLLLYARQQCRSDADAQDVLQDSLVQLVRAVHSCEFQGVEAQWFSYVCTTIRHRAIDRGRRETVRKNYATCNQAEAIEQDILDPWLSCASDDEYLRERVEDMLRSIPIEFAEVITLKIWGERTFQQIADILGQSLPTVASRYRYGINAMRKLLDESPIE